MQACGTPAGSAGTENQRRQVYDGEIRKCPSCVTSMEGLAFSNCSLLGTIKYTGTKENWNAISFGLSWGKDVTALGVTCSDGKKYRFATPRADNSGPLSDTVIP